VCRVVTVLRVGAFLIDLANAIIITVFLNLLG
jgi:Na+/glutamate symporter